MKCHTKNHIMTPDNDASNRVTTKIGHDPASEPTNGLLLVV